MNLEMARTIEILPQLLKIISSGFEPKLDVKLKKVEFGTLMHIRFCEGKTMSYYAEKIGLENGSFTYLVDKLEKQGYVKRLSSEEDRRKKMLNLTQEGNKITDKVYDQFIAHTSEKFNVLTDSEKKRYLEFLDIGNEIKDILIARGACN